MHTATATSTGAAARAVRAGLALVLFGGTALVILHDWFGVGGPRLDTLAGGDLYGAVVIAAGLACLLRARAVPWERGAWLLIGAAILCRAAGEVLGAQAILDGPRPPFPSLADAFYLAFYPLAYAGLIRLVSDRAHELNWRRWADGVIAALGTMTLGVAFVFDFVADRTTGTTLEVAVSLGYPLGDIGMLAMIVGVIALTDWRPGWTWLLLLVGLTAQVVADIAYTLQATDGVLPPGSWTDPIYLISASCLGALLWLPDADPIQPERDPDRWRELIAPALIAGIMLGLFSMQLFNVTSETSILLITVTVVAVVVRLGMSTMENARLLEQVRTDALTELGNRGGMQVDLEAICARATEGHPATLYLFDLNGFKHYNDTFGHPAGDALLRWLGARLREAVAGSGAAYRIGGDEFCALLTCDPHHVDAVAKRAAEALCAQVHGVSVTASWGSARIPAEVGAPLEALQLADVRMYAQKESRRLAREEFALPTSLTPRPLEQPPQAVQQTPG